jgi:hypothetical protein
MSMIVSCPVALLLEIETTVERAKKDAENELNVLGMFIKLEMILFLAKKQFYLFSTIEGVRASGPNRFVMAKKTATRCAANSSVVKRLNIDRYVCKSRTNRKYNRKGKYASCSGQTDSPFRRI